MNFTKQFVFSQVAMLALLCGTLMAKHPVVATPPIAPVIIAPIPQLFNVPAIPVIPVDPELVDVQVPLEKSLRIYNKSGSQCGWCTLQMLGQINHQSKLEGLVDVHKGSTGPPEVKSVVDRLGVPFRQIYNRNDDSFLDKYVTENHFGVGIGIRGYHVVLVCHWDKAAGIVKVIDNADRSLSVQTWSMSKFRQLWDGWAFTVFPEGYTEKVVQPECPNCMRCPNTWGQPWYQTGQGP